MNQQDELPKIIAALKEVRTDVASLSRDSGAVAFCARRLAEQIQALEQLCGSGAGLPPEATHR